MRFVTNRKVAQTEKVFERFTVNIGGNGTPEVVKLEGRKHLKVPAVIINEGVLDGSHGPGFYPAEENGKRVSAWNHMPITLDHPTIRGKRVTARTPKVLNRFKVGVFLNAKQEGTKTKGFAYLDIGRTRQLDARLLRRLQKGEKVEVSTGLSVRQEFKKGVHNNKKYDWIARDQEPDHLAVLMDSVGACSVKDGAGLLANEAKVPESVSTVLRKSVEELVKGIGVEKIVGNEMSFSQVSMHLSNALSAAYGKPGQYWRGYVCEVFPDSVVYYGEDGKLYRVGYKTTKTTVELTGDAEEVSRQIEYVPVSNSNSLEEVVNMAFDKKAHVKSLIGNGFDESDKTWLLKLDDAQLQKIRPRKKKEKPVANTDEGKKTKTETPVPELNWEQIEKLIPKSKLAAMEFGEQTIANQKQQAKEVIKKSKGNKLSDEQLDKLPYAVLVNMASVAAANEKPAKSKSEDVDADDEFANDFNPNFFNFSGVPGSFGVTNEDAEVIDEDDDEEEDEEDKTPAKKKVAASNTTKSKAAGPRKWNYPNRIGASTN